MERSPSGRLVCQTHAANRVHRTRTTTRLDAVSIALTLAGYLCMNCDSLTQTLADASQIQTSNLDQQIRDFLQREVAAHVDDITTLGPPPDRVVGALTTDAFSWRTFIRTPTPHSHFPR